jgi:hypothetical protein
MDENDLSYIIIGSALEIMLLKAKKQVCITVFVLLPMPAS